jgi:Predicted UDP-glucose 6-dehydrogenase
MREAPSIVTANLLLDSGANVKVFDPVAMNESKKHYLKDTVYYAKNIYDAADGADVVALITEWKQFRLPNWEEIKKRMAGNIIVDGRNIYNRRDMQSLGFEYYSIGK